MIDSFLAVYENMRGVLLERNLVVNAVFQNPTKRCYPHGQIFILSFPSLIFIFLMVLTLGYAHCSYKRIIKKDAFGI